jgi:hypothetical protein
MLAQNKHDRDMYRIAIGISQVLFKCEGVAGKTTTASSFSSAAALVFAFYSVSLTAVAQDQPAEKESG